MAGAPKGNTNSNQSNRLWADTIRRVVTQADGKKLREIAEKLMEKAHEGDIQAIKELGDRLDGRPSQSIEQKTELTATVQTSNVPDLTKEEWLAAHGLGTAGATTG